MVKRYMYAVVKIKFPDKRAIYKIIETTSEFIPENHLTSRDKYKNDFAKSTKCELEVASNLREYCEWWVEMQAKGGC